MKSRTRRRRAEWETDGIAMVCSKCRKNLVVEQGDAEMNFCPICGADMRAEEREDDV